MSGISKRFGAIQAVDAVDFEARPGEITALLGENGAGKSTLMKLLFGLHRPDAGRIELDGREVRIDSPRAAIAAGVGMVMQQFSLIPSLSIRENLALVVPAAGWWIGRDARRLGSLADHLRRIAPELDPGVRVSSLSVGQMQLVELAKVLLLEARCVILDEPSAVLTPVEAQRLWQSMRDLAARGLSVVLITHKLNDVRACADRVSVMRAGRSAGTTAAAGIDEATVVEWMVGVAPPPVPARHALSATAAPRLVIRSLTAGIVRDIDLQVRAGEIVGVAGVSGNGQTALAEAVAGMLPVRAGQVLLDGEVQAACANSADRQCDSRGRLGGPRARAGSRRDSPLGYIPEQPLVNAVAPGLSLALNLALKRIAALPFLADRSALEDDARRQIARFDVRPGDPRALAGWLSGGNLQKLVVARELADSPAAVIACYPTMGLDITAAAEVYRALFQVARAGGAVLWISEDLDDLLRFAHRIAVMLDGRIVRVFDAPMTNMREVATAMAGGHRATLDAEAIA